MEPCQLNRRIRPIDWLWNLVSESKFQPMLMEVGVPIYVNGGQASRIPQRRPSRHVFHTKSIVQKEGMYLLLFMGLDISASVL